MPPWSPLVLQRVLSLQGHHCHMPRNMSRSEVFWICRSTLIGQIMSSCFGILESVCFPNCNWAWFKTNSCFVLSCNESNMTDGAAVSILLLSSWTNWWGPTNLVACFALMKVGMYWRTRYFHLWAVLQSIAMNFYSQGEITTCVFFGWNMSEHRGKPASLACRYDRGTSQQSFCISLPFLATCPR